MTPTSIVAYLALFATVGFLFLFAALLLGWFLRARVPSAEKLEIYECGEPPIGSGFVQFNLRFYVVALVFIIFEVEVAFFFPWATVFGKATQLTDPNVPGQQIAVIYEDMGVPSAVSPEDEAGSRPEAAEASTLALASMADIAVFFGVLLVGFAYVWKRGDLNWVRAIRSPADEAGERTGLDATTPTTP